MANAVARVPSGATKWGDDKIKRPLAAAAAIYYPGAMMAIDASGNGVKCDDTSGIRFDGINADTDRIQVFSGEAAGDRTVNVERPWRFTMAIASAVAGDEGKAVYAVDDNHVGYTSSNSILIGWVDKVLSATSVLVIPLFAPLNPVAVSSNVLAFTGATTVDQITFPDNLADALSFKEGSNSYLTFITTNSSEAVNFHKNITLDALNIALDATTGTKLGTATTQKLAFWNATPIVQPANTVDYVTMLTNLGLRATGGTADATFPGGVLSIRPTGSGIGYATGAGGAVTQATNRATGVTLSKLTGQITTNNASLAAAAFADFIVTNTTVAATDTIVVSIIPGGTGSPVASIVNVASGSFTVRVLNQHAATADTSADVINFAVLKAVAA